MAVQNTTKLRVALGAVALAALFTLLSVPNAGATFPGRNGEIIFDQSQPPTDGHSNFAGYTVRPDGSHLRMINPPSTEILDPSFSANGRLITFGGSTPSSQGIYVMRAGGSSAHLLTSTDALSGDFPAFSPDGKLIAYRCFVGSPGESEICVVRANGSNPHPITAFGGGTDSGGPEFSPNGKRIVFHALRAGNPNPTILNADNIYTMRPNGSGLRNLTNATDSGEGPDFSPDGKRIVFDGANGITVMNSSDGSHKRVLMADGFSPEFSPDGKQILFIKYTSDFDSSFFVMRTNGSHVHQVPMALSGALGEEDWGVRPVRRRHRH